MQPTDNPLKRRVRLYYLGGLTDGNKVAYVQSKGRPFRLPSVGESIEVPLYYAHDLIQRSHNGVHAAWSLSERDGQMAKAGTLFRDTSRMVDPGTLTIEDLQRMLEERQASSPKSDESFQEKLRQMAVVDDDEALDDEGSSSEPEEKPKRKPGRPPKNKPEEQEEASE